MYIFRPKWHDGGANFDQIYQNKVPKIIIATPIIKIWSLEDDIADLNVFLYIFPHVSKL